MTLAAKHIETYINDKLNQVQNLLLKSEQEVDRAFHAKKELDAVVYRIGFLPENDAVRSRVAFEYLKPNYEAGLLLENQDGVWMLKGKFCMGDSERANTFKTTLPAMKTSQVLKFSAALFTTHSKLNLPYFSEEATSLLFRPSEKFAYILFSEFAGVELKELSKNTHEFLLKAFAY